MNEKDKAILNSIIESGENHCHLTIDEVEWLKSLRQQLQTKPISPMERKLIFESAIQLAQGVLESDNSLLSRVVTGVSHDLVAKNCVELARRIYLLSME